MPNGKRRRKARARREAVPPGIASCFQWFAREVFPLLRRRKLPRTRSAEHLRNATIEVLEAARALLDETIAWLRTRRPAELKRIRVEE